MNHLKSLFILVPLTACLLFSQHAAAQFSLGGGVTYGEGIEEFGVSARAAYAFNESFEMAAKYSYFFADDGVDFSMIDLDTHFTFFGDDSVSVYGLGGLNISIFDFDDVDIPGVGEIDLGSETELGANVGVGFLVNTSDRLGIFGEAKYVIGDADQFVFTTGLRFGF